MPARQSILVAAALCALTGCRAPWSAENVEPAEGIGPFGKLSNPMEWGADSDKPREGTPRRVVATWVDTVRQQPGKGAERGFGGRLYFYDGGADPITVDGRLVVYAFDEEGRLPTDHKPTRRYVFPADQLTRHMSESKIGPSYSVWLPWGAVDGAPTQVSLIARFEPIRGGGLVVSDQATEWLPGQGVRSPDEGATQLADDATGGGVRQAGFASSEAVTKPADTEPVVEEPKKRLSTTTIRLRR